MSRLYTRNAQGRQPLLASKPRFSKFKDRPNDTYQEPGGKKRRSSRNYATTIKQAKLRRVASTASDSSTGESDDADDASDEDSEDDDDEPAFVAPSRRVRRSETGRKFRDHFVDELSLPASNESMFGELDDYYHGPDDPNLSPEENRKMFEEKVFAESDGENDDAYKAVDDISDSDEEANLSEVEEKELIASLTDDDDADQDLYLNQIDGLSAYGFGDDSDGTVPFPPSSHGEESATEAGTERRVRFDIESAARYHMRMSDSPTIARALLPSALPDPLGVFGGPAAAAAEPERGPLLEDEYDSDVTDDCLPEEAHHSTPNALQHTRVEEPQPPHTPSPSPKKSAKKSSQRKGPPRGVFIDEGDKASGILDATGKFVLITHPHLLGEEFAKRYGASQSSSPEIGLEELLDETDADDAQADESTGLIGASHANIMLASLNSGVSDPAYLGQAISPAEAFMEASNFDFGDYEINPDDLEEDFQHDPELGEDVIDIHDILRFDGETDDSDDNTSPIFMPPKRDLSGIGNINNEYSHLTNINVTAFRRNADPKYAALNNPPAFSDIYGLSTPNNRRKRKVNESPYHSSHYKGVQPVQRMRDPNSSPALDPVGPSKRRKIMT